MAAYFNEIESREHCDTKGCGKLRLKPFDYCEVCIQARADALAQSKANELLQISLDN